MVGKAYISYMFTLYLYSLIFILQYINSRKSFVYADCGQLAVLEEIEADLKEGTRYESAVVNNLDAK